MQDISCLVLPIPAHAFFKQAVLQGEIGHHLLQGGGFTTKVLHLAGRRGAGGVARQPALAGLQELLRPAVIHRGGDAFPAAQLRDVLLATQSFQHNADLLFGRILLPRRPADVADKLLGRTSGGNGFLSHLRSLAATMSQKSSVPQAAKFVSQALKRDTRHSPSSGLWDDAGRQRQRRPRWSGDRSPTRSIARRRARPWPRRVVPLPSRWGPISCRRAHLPLL